MLFYIQIQNKEYKVRVESRQQKFFVQFENEEEREIDINFQGNDCLFLDDTSVFFANVVGQKDGVTVWRPQGNISLQVESEYRKIVGVLRGQELNQENNVVAKMPGKISKILVKEGDIVEKGTPLLVMEAMKMENEIRASLSGTVKSLRVKEGQAIESGALLLEIL